MREAEARGQPVGQRLTFDELLPPLLASISCDTRRVARDMAGRKKTSPVPPPDGARAFAVVVEQLRGEFKVFGEALGGLRQEMNDGFGEVKRDLSAVKRDVGEVQRELGEVKVDLALVKSAATTHTRELREIRSALGNKVERGEVETIVEHTVARIAQR